MPLLSFDEHRIENNEIYSQLIVGNSDSPVSSLIAKLSNSDWVRQGLEYLPEIDDDSHVDCPFCQNHTITKLLAGQISDYFDESYDESIGALSNYLGRYKDAANSLQSLESYKGSPFSDNHALELANTHTKLEKVFIANLAEMERKLQTPSIQVSLLDTTELIKSFNDVITLINQEVIDHNARLKNVTDELESLKSEFWLLMRWQYDQTIAPYLTQYNALEVSLSEAKESQRLVALNVEGKQDEISELQKSTVNIEEAVGNINDGLSAIGMTDFTIEKHGEALYRIVRVGKAEAAFSSLSEGEKMIISFLYYCEVCKGKRTPTETPKKKIAVIDDPVSSLSNIYVYNIGRLIHLQFLRSDAFDQVFILTHSLYFFYELTDTNRDRRTKNQNLFRLSKNTDGTSIRSMSYQEIQNDYQSYWAVIVDENQSPALIANCMRNIIEYFFSFVQKVEFNNVFQKAVLQDNRFQAFERYVNRESHSLGQNIFDLKEFDYSDFKEGLRLVFEATGYKEHYNKMISSIAA